MNTEPNATCLTFGGHVEIDKYRYLYFTIMFTMYILIICSNSTIVCLIVIHRSLHKPMYVFIAALLLNSVFFSTVIYPKLLMDFLSEKQTISYRACLFQVFFFYVSACTEFLLLSAMAFDRYVSICKPLQYPTIMGRRTVNTLLVLAWLVPACHIAVPVVRNANLKLCSFTLKGIFCNNTVQSLPCANSRALLMYGAAVMFNVTLLPMLLILFTYAKILVVVYWSCGEVKKKAAQTCLPHLLVLINYSCLLIYDLIIVRMESDFSQTARFVMTLQIVIYNPLLNPIIYGLKMKEISKHLTLLFCQVKVS
ncbi:olfactory receptor 6N2-like [Acanthochromis polyacanthus]|uniref:olfactory receptor 6N2-like n=1 Tax=Acanthochromis polyacanthus TaxID=80966 RepID=UPI00223491CC|nr:olfactory receptor 6N2-like [Acanthochromis polyacanthus]